MCFQDLRAIPNAAYQFHKEVLSLEELDVTSKHPDAMYMQSLLIRERILGSDHKDTIFGLMYRGAVYADTHRYVKGARMRTHVHHKHKECTCIHSNSDTRVWGSVRRSALHQMLFT